MKYEIRSNVVNGNLKRNRNLIIDAIQSFEGKEIIVTFERAKKKRSNPQNAFWHGVVIPIMQQALKDAGHLMTNEQTHDLLKLRFLKETILANENGEYIERIKSTTELTTTQFMELIQEVQRFAVEYFNVIVPDPNENITLDL